MFSPNTDYSLHRLTLLLAKSCCVANRLPDSVTTPLTRFISSRTVNSCSSSINLHLHAHFLTRNTVLQPSATINFSTSANQQLFSNKNPPNGAFSKAKWAAGAITKKLNGTRRGGVRGESEDPSVFVLLDWTTM